MYKVKLAERTSGHSRRPSTPTVSPLMRIPPMIPGAAGVRPGGPIRDREDTMTTHPTGTREQWRAAYERQLEDFDADFFGYMHVPTPRQDYGAGSGSMLDVMELMALSCFALEDGVVHHTYSTYDRGTEALNATWQLLDRAPRGRGEDFSDWPRKRDEYSV